MGEYIIEEKVIRYDGKNIYGKAYFPKAEGKFPMVIFSHGYNGSHDFFDSYGKFLAANGVAAYCYDFCGGSVNSKSSLKTTEMTIFTEEDDLRAVIKDICTWIKTDKDNLFLFGESQGGLVTALTTEEYAEEVRGMILLYPAFCIADNWTEKYADINSIPEIIPFWGMDLGRNFMESIHGFDVREHIGRYENNVMILHGDKDTVVSQNYSLEMVEKYKKGRLVVFPGEGHGFSEEGNDKVRHMLLEFIKVNMQ